LTPAAKHIYHRLFRFQLQIKIWLADLWPRRSEIPLPPAKLRFRVSETLSAGEFLRVGEGCARLIREHADMAQARRVLDFGCGCGRTIRWFLTDGGAEFHGADVDPDAIEWCSRNLKSGHFAATPPVPPLPYPSESFDLIYCLSVFTHLNESMQDLWLAELRRVLKPGGELLLTIYGASAIASLDEHDRRTLRDHGFVHKRSQKLKGLVPDWYQTSWHSREYMLDRLLAGFENVRYHVVPDGKQDVIVATKTTVPLRAPQASRHDSEPSQTGV
jgi:SAM-dependent methyltransferase